MELSVILNLAIIIVVVGGLLYLLKMAPIDETIKKVGTVLAILVVIVWALKWLIAQLAH